MKVTHPVPSLHRILSSKRYHYDRLAWVSIEYHATFVQDINIFIDKNYRGGQLKLNRRLGVGQGSHLFTLGLTCIPCESLDLTLFHLASLGLTWVSLGLTWNHLASLGITRSTRCHWVPLLLTWSHLASLGFTWFRLFSLGLTWVSLGPAGTHLTHSGSLGLTWTHLDPLDSLDHTREKEKTSRGQMENGTPQADIWLALSP